MLESLFFDYKTETLVDVAYKALKKDIMQRVLAPGQKIVVRELHERYGLSETPIKQALNRLITEGLVESIPRKGIKVRSITWKEIEDLMDIRFMIETYYLRQAIACVKNNPDIRKKFEANMAEHMKVVTSDPDVDMHFQNYSLDEEFHQLFIQCSGNSRVLQIFKSLGTHDYACYVYGKEVQEGRIAGVREHQAIFQAMIEEDEEKLKQAIEAHLKNAKKRIEKIFMEDEAMRR